MATLKKVITLRGKYRQIFNGSRMVTYLGNCIAAGSVAPLFLDPHILAAFYASGTTAKTAISTAITNHEAAPTVANANIVKDKVALAKIWLDSYADQVEVIANLPINCTTRAEAATNISISFLTPQKIVFSAKGAPDKPELVAKNIGTSTVEVEVTNGIEFVPTSMVFIAVEQPPTVVPAIAEPLVSLTRGQLVATCDVAIHTVMISVEGKGRIVTFDVLKPGSKYKIYAYAMNGKKQISLLSVGVLVQG